VHSHAGSLQRPEDLIALNEQRAAGDFSNEEEYLGRLRAAVADVVACQRDTGIDLVNDGELGPDVRPGEGAPDHHPLDLARASKMVKIGLQGNRTPEPSHGPVPRRTCRLLPVLSRLRC